MSNSSGHSFCDSSSGAGDSSGSEIGAVKLLAEKAHTASRHLALASTEAKNEMLLAIATALEENRTEIVEANAHDLATGRANGLSNGLLDRLLIDSERLEGIARDVRTVATLEDHVGRVMEDRVVESGLRIQRVRVPIGVVGIIYEARPNVTVDASVLCIKSGNAVILKGGRDAIHSNIALVRVMKEALGRFDVGGGSVGGGAASGRGSVGGGAFVDGDSAPISDAIQLIKSVDRSATGELLKLKGLVDVIIPRGSKGLIDFVCKHSRVPVIETGASIVHVYVDAAADLKMAARIVLNAKLRRTSICNALDVVLVHKEVLQDFVRMLRNELNNDLCATAIGSDGSHDIASGGSGSRDIASGGSGGGCCLEIHADKHAHEAFIQAKMPDRVKLTKATNDDFDTEFLDAILAVKVVDSLNEAVDHISIHSLKHSEAIVTEDAAHAEKFLSSVDAACVYWNASTQFSDGGQFGLGAEIGISTQKLHARGPFALEGLTSYKWVIRGNGELRA